MEKKSRIIMQAECSFIDEDARRAIMKLEERNDSVNKRTKIHTLDIKKIEGRLKSLEAMKNGR